MKKTRIHYTHEATPIIARLDDVRKTMAKLEFEPMFMVYDGTAARTRVWCNDDGTFRAKDQLDWDRERHGGGPAEDWEVVQCGRLAMKANFYDSTLPPTVSAITDFEAQWWSPTEAEIQLANEAHVNVFQHVGDGTYTKRIYEKMTYHLFNLGINAGNQRRTRIGAYGWPDDGMLRESTVPSYVTDFFKYCDFAAPSLYTTPNYMANNTWFDWASNVVKNLDRHFPWLPRILVLNPMYAVWGSEQTVPNKLHLHNYPLPAGLARKQAQFAADHDCEILVWNDPDAPLRPDVLRSLLEIAEVKA